MTVKEYPLELGTVTPGPGFTKMELGKNLEGLPEGAHTGGPWLSPDGLEVWKPLDAMPCPNATVRYGTDEDKCLTEMEDAPGFVHNWRIETVDGRRWLVRPFCWLWPQDERINVSGGLDTVKMVEQAVRELNSRGWEAFGSDLPQVALDPNGDLFLLDLSAAFKPSTWKRGWHGDEMRVLKWMELVGYGKLADLRRRGRDVAHNIAMSDIFDRSEGEPYRAGDVFYDVPHKERSEYHHIYASTRRPMSSLWARMDGVRYLDADPALTPRVHTWVASDHELDQDTIDRYELTWAWSPWA